MERAAPTLHRIRQSRDQVAIECRRMILQLGTAEGYVERSMSVSAWGHDFARKALLLGFKRR